MLKLICREGWKMPGICVIVLLCQWNLVAQTDSSSIGIKGRGGAVIAKDSLSPVKLPDTLASVVPADTVNGVKKDFFVTRFFKKGYPNPRKAALMSLIVPGSGQAYNRKWWKIPIVYGVLGGLGYLEANNIHGYKVLKTNYKAMVDENPATVVAPEYANKDRTTLKAERDAARKNLETSSLILGLGYLLAVSDAFVDAHLATFDVSDDLSMKICPKTVPVPGFGPAFGVALSFALDK